MSRINNYTELLEERKKLEVTLQSQKAILNTQLNTLKERFEPLAKVVSFLGGLNKNPGTTLLKMGSYLGIELMERNKLAKTGWLAKLILPFILKYTAAKTIDNVQERITE